MKSWGPSDWAGALEIVQFAGLAVLLIAGYWLKQHFVAQKDYQALGARVDGHAARLTLGDSRFKELENRFNQVPTADAIAGLGLRMERLSGDIRVLSERFAGSDKLNATVKRQVELMDEFLRRSK